MKIKKIFPVCTLIVCLVLALCACGTQNDGSDQDAVTWTLEEIDTPVEIHTELQLSYLTGDYRDISTYATGDKELSRPVPLTLSWVAEPKNADDEILSYVFEYATKEDFSDSLQYATAERSYDVINLAVGTEYYWRVTAKLESGGQATSPVSTFTTADRGPRNLYVDGVTNVRDLGGWATSDGGRVKQGLIYRCGRLNKSETETPVIEITDDGIWTMLSDLGVRTEIDLRTKDNHEAGGITSSPLGELVDYRNVELEWNNDNYLLNNLDSVREFFEIASDEASYPLIFHCNIGTDRTGMFAFLINGLLGVSEEDLYRDYLFSNFANIGGERGLSNIQNNYLKTVKAAAGETLSEKIRNCLIDCGVPSSQLDAVVNILK